jgi:hypothetical protein
MKLRRGKALVAVSALAAVGVIGSLAPSGASSHREAPLISQDPSADATDTYAFVSPESPSTVTFVANWIPLEEPAGGPNFYKFSDDVNYQINIDNNGDAVPDLTYEFRFATTYQNKDTFLYNTGPIKSVTDPNFNVRQMYSVAKVEGGQRTIVADAQGLSTPPVNIGPRSNPNYEATAQSTVYNIDGGGTRVFAGQRDDPFFVDLGSAFDLLGLRPFNKAHLIKQATAKGVDAVAGYNVHTIAIQVPIVQLTQSRQPLSGPSDPSAVIGVWSTAQRYDSQTLKADGTRAHSDTLVNVSRLGMPLVNEVVVPLKFKDFFNGSEPKDDAANGYAPLVTDPEIGKLIPALYPGVKVPPAPRNDLVSIFLTGIPGLNQPMNAPNGNVQPAEMLRLNMAVPPKAIGKENRLGVLGGDNAGFPNGRRLADDVVDIELRAVAGATPFTPDFNHAPNNQLGDGVDHNDKKFTSSFPYLAEPWQGYARKQH